MGRGGEVGVVEMAGVVARVKCSSSRARACVNVKINFDILFEMS